MATARVVRPHRPRGPAPLPRLHLNQPAFYNAVRATGRELWLLALAADILQPFTLSTLVNAEAVPDTRYNRERLERIADVVGFDKTQLFLDGVV